MAITEVVVRRSNDELEVDITATADGDTDSALVDHGLGLERPTAFIVPTLVQALAVDPLWRLTTLNGTQFRVSKLATVGSGNAAVQLRVVLKRAR